MTAEEPPARMLIEARLENERRRHSVSLSTNGIARALEVPARPNGFGSGVNGAELLCLALATCYCNDVYREADKRGIVVTRVEVVATAEFGSIGEAARSLRYRANVFAQATADAIRELMLDTDCVAEVQGTLRRGTPVLFEVGDVHPQP